MAKLFCLLLQKQAVTVHVFLVCIKHKRLKTFRLSVLDSSVQQPSLYVHVVLFIVPKVDLINVFKIAFPNNVNYSLGNTHLCG